MLISQPLDLFPIGWVLVLTSVVLFLSAEAGYLLGKRLRKRWPDRSESGVGAMVGASLALLGFLLAFITSVAVNIFNERLQLVVAEANAIGTTYLRAGYIGEPMSTESRQLLREYVDMRLAGVDRNRLDAVVTRSEQIHDELWSRAEVVARETPSPTIALYIASLNEVIDLHTERLNIELGIRVPPVIVFGLYLVAVFTMMLIGIHGSYSEKRNLLALVVMIVILSVVFLLVVELDRSHQGLIKIPQKALLDLQRHIQAGP
jgi:hypothetical protein